jgi:hypothetical protein
MAIVLTREHPQWDRFVQILDALVDIRDGGWKDAIRR